MFRIAIKEAKEFFRSPVAVFMVVFFPCMLVYTLGTMLQHLDVADFEIGDVNVQYALTSDENYSNTAFETFLTESDFIKAEKADNSESALNLTDKGEINAYIEFDGRDIKLYTGDNKTVNRALESIINSYQQMADTYAEIAKVAPEKLQEALMKDFSDTEFTSQNGLGVTRSMIDYYAVTIIVMMIFMSGITSNSETFNDERKNNTYSRLVNATTPRISIFFGKVLGGMPVCIINVVVTMVFSVLLFNANYCSDIGGNILLAVMLMSLAFAATSIGTLLGLVMKIPAVSVIIPICWTMLFLSGSFSKEIFVEGLSNNLPPYLVQQAAFNLTLFGNTTPAIIVTIICTAIFIMATAIGALVFTKRKSAI